MKRFVLTTLLSLTLSQAIFAQAIIDPFDDNALSDYLTAQRFSGAVLLRSGQGLETQMASGTGDLAGTRPLNSSSRFRIASITKLFTAVLVMQLVDEGKMTLDSTIDELLAGLSIANAGKITVRNLLQHTSGLRNEAKTSYMAYNSPDKLIERFATKKALFKPGKDLNYNNIDYIILGKIIEQLTGKSFSENLQERIIDKLNLKDTGIDTTFEKDQGVVASFMVKDGQKKPETKAHIENIWAAGDMYSTVTDLLIFVDALKAEKLVSRSSMDKLFKSEPKLGYVALGSWTFNSPFISGSPRVLERRGGILGSTSVIMTNLNGPETLIVLSNTDEFNPDTFGQADNMKEYLFKALFEEEN
ncbi:MAG: serine hydrolase domain-containing protein [Roseivirga sp.]